MGSGLGLGLDLFVADFYGDREMKPWETLGSARTPDGTLLSLHQRGEELVIRADGKDLMSNRAHHSEEEMARLAPLGSRNGACVLVGGLGMGYTLRAVLDLLSRSGRVVVSELCETVVTWNRGILAPLAGRPLDDPRVTVEIGDVAALMRASVARFDAILLDVDNGPEAVVQGTNAWLYGPRGLAAARAALRPGGALAIWCAGEAARFEERLARAGFEAETHRLRSRGKRGGARHTIFVGRVPLERRRPQK